MALTVEDGTGLADADSFVSVAAADAYHDARGNTAWVSSSSPADEDKEQALRRASYFLSNSYSWQGYPVNGRSQALAWPRTGVTDAEDYAVPSTSVPREIADATCEIALRELVSPGAMNPDVTLSAQVKREKVDVLEVEYSNAFTDADASRPILLIVRDMIGGLLKTGSSNSLVGEAVRW